MKKTDYPVGVIIGIVSFLIVTYLDWYQYIKSLESTDCYDLELQTMVACGKGGSYLEMLEYTPAYFTKLLIVYILVGIILTFIYRKISVKTV